MKKITDTYYDLTGRKKYIGKNTVIECKDLIAKSQIEAIANHGEDKNAITVIGFYSMNDEIKTMVKKKFKEADPDIEDSYVILVEEEKISIYTNSENGVRYAACAIRSHYDNGISMGLLCNVPLCSVRGVKLYIPAKEHIGFFKEIVDMCMEYGYNTMYMEVGGAMEYKRHPEINVGWEEYGNFLREYPRKASDVNRTTMWVKNSIHWENGGGSYLSQQQLRELLEYCRKRGITVIPEVPSLSHCDYLMLRHPEIAENKEDPFPDTYCPSDPRSYELLFDVLDEVVEVFEPPMVHIAHDEWLQICMCDKCRGKDPAIVLANDIRKIYNYLKSKGVDTMIWGDKLLDARTWKGVPHGGAETLTRRTKMNKTVAIKGREYPVYEIDWELEAGSGTDGEIYGWPATWRAINMVPSDLKIMNWLLWDSVSTGGNTDEVFHAHNLWNIYGNFNSEIENWFGRVAKGVQGISISNWSMLDERHMQRNAVLLEMVQASRMLWNREFDEKARDENVVTAAHDLFLYHYREVLHKPHIEIIHGTDFVIPHEIFVDGNLMEDEKDRIGYYNIHYTDGTIEKCSVLWGYNIGYSGGMEDRPEDEMAGTIVGESYVLEPTYTCDYVFEDGRRYYRWIIPTERTVESVVPEIFEKYMDKTVIKEINIVV